MISEADVQLENAGRARNQAEKLLAEAETSLAKAQEALDAGGGGKAADAVVRAEKVLESARRVLARRTKENEEAGLLVKAEREVLDRSKLAELAPRVARWRDSLAPHVARLLTLVAEIDEELVLFGVTLADEEERYMVAVDLASSLTESTSELKANAPSLPAARLHLQRELTVDRERRASPDMTPWLASISRDWRLDSQDAASRAMNEAALRQAKHAAEIERAEQAAFVAALAFASTKNAPPAPPVTKEGV